jgi:hypothetical protein
MSRRIFPLRRGLNSLSVFRGTSSAYESPLKLIYELSVSSEIKYNGHTTIDPNSTYFARLCVLPASFLVSRLSSSLSVAAIL